jgi:DNA-binding transcriptional MocR family regulator
MSANEVKRLRETSKINLYEDVSRRILHLIDKGVYKIGDRIPSVRALSHQLSVSISTVTEAYRLMEDQGRIEARPQSGYYVRPYLPHLPEPKISQPICEPTPVSSGELVMRVMRDTANPRLLQLGAAIPNPELLPLAKLSRSLTAVLRKNKNLGSSYDAPLGCESLRIHVARRALGAGCELAPDQIITTVGGAEALTLCLQAVCRSGDTIAIESPMFYGVLQAIESLGLKALEIPTHPRDGISLEALRDALEQNDVRACLVIPNFNNPLGSCMPDENKKALAELLAARDIALIEDDVYGELYFGSERPKVVKAFDKTGNVMLCSSFSKTVAPGYRVGWVAAGRFQPQVEYLKFVRNVSTPVPTQMAVAAFLESGGYDHHLRHIRRIYAKQVGLMAQAVARYFPENTKVTRPQGGYVLWVEMPSHVDSVELYRMALHSGVTLAPGPIFSAQQKYSNFIRLNAAFWSEKVKDAIENLGRLAAEMKKIG